jgi:hypothetical protein
VSQDKSISDTDMAPVDPDTTTDTRRGEEVIQEEGSEPGRAPNVGTKGESQRPYGTSDAESATGVAPDRSAPTQGDMPDVQPGDAGG